MRGVQIWNRKVSLMNDIVIGDHNSRNTGQKDRVTGVSYGVIRSAYTWTSTM